jgi:hypothetical protein
MRIPGVLLLCGLALPLAADEGMWLFNQFPKEQVKKSYNFDVTDQFLANLRLASLKIGSNGGALVSPNGLILTDRSTVAAPPNSPPRDFMQRRKPKNCGARGLKRACWWEWKTSLRR